MLIAKTKNNDPYLINISLFHILQSIDILYSYINQDTI